MPSRRFASTWRRQRLPVEEAMHEPDMLPEQLSSEEERKVQALLEEYVRQRQAGADLGLGEFIASQRKVVTEAAERLEVVALFLKEGAGLLADSAAAQGQGPRAEAAAGLPATLRGSAIEPRNGADTAASA